jgi:hypothetical protein
MSEDERMKERARLFFLVFRTVSVLYRKPGFFFTMCVCLFVYDEGQDLNRLDPPKPNRPNRFVFLL